MTTQAHSVEPGLISTGEAQTVSSGRPLVFTAAQSQGVAGKPRRFDEVDFSKGALVLTMVLYHWMNYFVQGHEDGYRYLRFLTPSFIFLAGFVISYVYRPRLADGKRKVFLRLVTRGLKLLALVFVLNAGILLMRAPFGESQLIDVPGMGAALLSGTGRISFSILVPIAYLMILSAMVLVASSAVERSIHFTAAVIVIASFSAEILGVGFGYGELVGMGMVGLSMGCLPVETIMRLLRSWVPLLALYAAYLAALTVWHAILPLQLIGTVLSVGVLLKCGSLGGTAMRWKRALLLLGQYSLVAYIAQIFILQALRAVDRIVFPRHDLGILALIAAAVLTICFTYLLHGLRQRFTAFNRAYGLVFG